MPPLNPPLADPRERRFASHLVSVFEVGAHRIILATPKVAPNERGLNLVCLLDGNMAFSALEDDWLAERDDLAVAAIGYPVETGFDFDARSRDYTPTPPANWDGGKRQALLRPHGGADAFLDQLGRTLLPEIETRLADTPRRRTLWGHSYGGLFCLYALMRGELIFDRYEAASPSIWWGNGMVEALAIHELPSGRAVQLQLSHGEKEISSTGEHMVPVSRLEGIAQRLGNRAGLAVSLRVVQEAGHSEMFALSLQQAILAQ